MNATKMINDLDGTEVEEFIPAALLLDDFLAQYGEQFSLSRKHLKHMIHSFHREAVQS